MLIPALILAALLFYVASRYPEGSTGCYGWGFIATMVVAAGIYL